MAKRRPGVDENDRVVLWFSIMTGSILFLTLGCFFYLPVTENATITIKVFWGLFIFSLIIVVPVLSLFIFHSLDTFIVWLRPRKGIYHLLDEKEKMINCLNFSKFEKGDGEN